MMCASWVSLVVLAITTACASASYSYDSYGECVYPEVCKPPAYAFKKVLPVKGRFQWDESGGFCGSLSIQTMALTYGAWISQDNVRFANRGGLCFGHTDERGGCEVGPENYGLTARNLKLAFDEWDFMQPTPQAPAFKRWIKSHLVKGEPVMWAPMLKDDKHTLYGRVSVPGSGHFDHHEPIIGIGSNHDLSDPTVYDDDWLVHYSDYDLQPCYRNFSSLEDDTEMQGNCKNVLSKKGVMFPCFYKQVTYGLAVRGLNMFGSAKAPRVSLEVDRPDEPRVRLGHAQALLQATVTVEGLRPGSNYVLYRFNSTQALPDGMAIDLLDMTYEHRYSFTAKSESWSFQDPSPIASDSSTYYAAILANRKQVEVADSLKDAIPKAFLRVSAEAGAHKIALEKDVRTLGDPELSAAPSFQSLAVLPRAEWQPVGMAVLFAGALVTFAAVVHRLTWQRSRVTLLEHPALG